MTRAAVILLIATCATTATETCLAAGDPDTKKRVAPLPNGYALFFASDSEVALVKDGVNHGACVAGPHVVELGISGRYIFGRIEPKKGIPAHPDHAPGFFVIDSATDKATTGLGRKEWIAALSASGVESPELHPPEQIEPKRY